MPSPRKIVKLCLMQQENNRTYVDSFEAQSFDDFLLVPVNFDEDTDFDSVEDLHKKLQETTNKTVLIIDKKLNINIYGVVEDLEDEKDDS